MQNYALAGAMLTYLQIANTTDISGRVTKYQERWDTKAERKSAPNADMVSVIRGGLFALDAVLKYAEQR